MKQVLQKAGMLAVMLLSMVHAAAYDFEVDGFGYNLLSATDFTCEIVDATVSSPSDTIVVPSSVKFSGRELTVTQIRGLGLLSKVESQGLSKGLNTHVTHVEIPNTVKSIGWAAFSTSNIAEIEIPESVEYIGDSGFAFCKNLQSVKLKCSIDIPHELFDGCIRLSKLEIPSTIESIGDYAFRSTLVTVIPKDVKRIGDYAYANCSGIKQLNIIPDNDDSTISLGEGAFTGSGLTEVNISGNLSVIPEKAFYDCRNLKVVNLPETVTTIKDDAFSHSPIEVFDMPNSVTTCRCNFLGTEYLKVSKSLSDTYVHFFAKKLEFKECDSRIIIHSEADNNYVEHLVLNRPCYGSGYSYVKWKALKVLEVNSIAAEDGNTCPLVKADSLETVILKADCITYTPDLRFGSNVKEIITYSEIPPTFRFRVSTMQYATITVRVPKGSEDAYRNADGWSSFWNIVANESTDGVDNIVVPGDKTEVSRYDINGREVDANYHGFVVVRYSDGTTEKRIQ